MVEYIYKDIENLVFIKKETGLSTSDSIKFVVYI